MASLIPCPFCGLRPAGEFTPRGEVPPPRPEPEAPFEAWHDHLYLRDNVRGRHLEHWHHDGGCRRWLVVERDTATHEVFSVVDARDSALAAQARTNGPAT